MYVHFPISPRQRCSATVSLSVNYATTFVHSYRPRASAHASPAHIRPLYMLFRRPLEHEALISFPRSPTQRTSSRRQTASRCRSSSSSRTSSTGATSRTPPRSRSSRTSSSTSSRPRGARPPRRLRRRPPPARARRSGRRRRGSSRRRARSGSAASRCTVRIASRLTRALLWQMDLHADNDVSHHLSTR